jgi:hypothetical protein
MVISTALMSLVLGGAYACFRAGLSTQALVHDREEILQNARVATTLFNADIRAACPISKEYDLVGIHRMLGERAGDNLDFATHHYKPRRRAESDWCEVSYFVDRDQATGRLSLWRRRDPTPDDEPFAGGTREEIAQGLLGLRFEYYDGFEWYDDWGDPDARVKAQSSFRNRPNLEGLPEAVRMTLWFDSKPSRRQSAKSESAASEPPLVFQTVARLELAGALLRRQSSGGASSGSSGQTTAMPQPGGGTP